MNKKELVQKFHPLVSLACSAYNLQNLFRIRKGRGNRVCAPCALLKNVTIHISGRNNRIIIEDYCRLSNCAIYIRGNDNTVVIGKWCILIGAELCIEDNGNEICMGDHTKIYGKTHLAAIEGTRILIGRDCLFSSDIHFRTGDSHSILDMDGRRINGSEDIVIGEHVWVGTKVLCLKGSQVADHCVVGAGALVTGSCKKTNCILAGVPVRVVKENIDWSDYRVPVGEVPPDYGRE